MQTDTSSTLNVVIADDHIFILDLLRQLISSQIEHCNVTTTSTYSGLISELNTSNQIDLALVDYKMPGIMGMRPIKKLVNDYPGLKLIVMSGYANKSDAQEFLNLGAMGYFPKTSSTNTMVCAIKLVLGGEKYMPSNFLEQTESLNAPKITSREYEVLSKLHIGYPNKRIAQSLELQEVTIKMYISRLCKKFDAKNRTQLIVKAINLGVL